LTTQIIAGAQSPVDRSLVVFAVDHFRHHNIPPHHSFSSTLELRRSVYWP